MNRTIHICRLPEDIQERLYAEICSFLNYEFPELPAVEIFREARLAMDGRLCDLEENLDLEAMGL